MKGDVDLMHTGNLHCTALVLQTADETFEKDWFRVGHETGLLTGAYLFWDNGFCALTVQKTKDV